MSQLIKGQGLGSNIALLIEDFPSSSDMETDLSSSGYAPKVLEDVAPNIWRDLYRTTLIKNKDLVLEIENALARQTKGRKDKAKLIKLIKEYFHKDFAQVEYLRNEIKSLGCNLLIPCGEVSFNLFTGLVGHRKYCGSILPCVFGDVNSHKLKVLPVMGPQALMQEYSAKFYNRIFYSRIFEHANSSPIPETGIRIWTAFNALDFKLWWGKCLTKKPQRLIFDIETRLGIPYCIAFTFDGKEACVIPLLDSRISKAEKALLWIETAKLLNHPISKGNQNIKYDWTILERWFFNVSNVENDTQIAAGCLYPEFKKNLGFLTSIYTPYPYHKDEGAESGTIDQKYLYCGKDVITDYVIMEKQLEELEVSTAKSVYQNLMKLLPIYKAGEQRGFRVDMEARAALYNKYTMLLNSQKLTLFNLCNQKFNPNSWQQKEKIIYGELGYSKGRFAQGTDEKSLLWLIANGKPHKAVEGIAPIILRCLINNSKLEKALQVIELPLWPDGTFRGTFNLVGTETGRTSAGKTLDSLLMLDAKGNIEKDEHGYHGTRLGHSPQTLAKHGFSIDGVTYGQDIRGMYVARRGYSFVEIDLSGAEARVDRVLAGQYDMSIFRNPGIHKYTGSIVYNCPPAEIKKHILVDGLDRYHVSKQVRHSAERGIQGGTLAEMLMVTKKIADGFLRTIHAAEPFIVEKFHHDVIQCITHTRMLQMPNGRVRQFFDRFDSSMEREAISTYPQAVVTDQTKFEGILKTSLECPWAFLLSEAHDGVLYEVPKGQEEEFAVKYKKNVETPIDFRKGSLQHDYELVIPCEAEFGENWSDMKELKI